MSGARRGSGPRSGLYSSQRFTNWAGHDPFWSEVSALPPKLRAAGWATRSDDAPLPIFERRLSPGFVGPVRCADVVELLSSVPREFVAALEGVHLMAGTRRQARQRAQTFGLYDADRIYLFPLHRDRLDQGLAFPGTPSELTSLRRFGAEIQRVERRSAVIRFDEAALERFYLYDVLLHEIGHHADRGRRRGGSSERYAKWFATFQAARLAPPSP